MSSASLINPSAQPSNKAGLPAYLGGEPRRSADNFLIFGKPHIGEAEVDAVTEVLNSKWIGTGPKTKAFEKAFAQYVGVDDALAVSSCTAALHLAFVTMGIAPGDEVIVPTMTFVSTANTVCHAGGTPVLVDCEAGTQLVTAAAIEAAITPRTKAVVVVHMAGRSCDMDAIKALTERHNLVLVEDCAHAIETTWNGRHAGTFGDFGCFSFYATKNMTTGEGGMLIAKDPKWLSRARAMSLHGLDKDAWARYSKAGFRHYQSVAPGFKYNLTDMASAMGLVQLASLEDRLPIREQIWNAYTSLLAGLPLDLPPDHDPRGRGAYHLYTVQVHADAGISRDALLDAMTAENIGCGVHYMPVHWHPHFRDTYHLNEADYPVAADIGNRTLSLPIASGMTVADVEDVIVAIRRIFANLQK